MGIQIQKPSVPPGDPTAGGLDKDAEGVETFGIGEVQAPDAPTCPMFLLIRARSKVLTTPSIFKSALAFQFEDLELEFIAFIAMA